MGGGSNIEGKSLACQLHFQSACKTEKNASAQGGLEFRDVSNSFRKGTRRENPSEESYLLTDLLSQNKICTFTCNCIILSASFQITHM